jgi:hypothetical protein
MVILDHWLPFSRPSGTGESLSVAEEELGVPAGANPHRCSNRRSGSALKSDGPVARSLACAGCAAVLGVAAGAGAARVLQLVELVKVLNP